VTEEAHRPPRGKRPPKTEIVNIIESNFCPKHLKHWIYGIKIIYFLIFLKIKKPNAVVCTRFL